MDHQLLVESGFWTNQKQKPKEFLLRDELACLILDSDSEFDSKSTFLR